jgi:DNA invertase Pin-like site-specific DNA recombinase
MKRAVIYARVSTKGQTPETQLKELRSYAQMRRFNVLYELIDIDSGAKSERPNLSQLMNLARKRKIDVVLVWKFDRFARSTKHLISALEEFRELGIDFISYTENIDTSTSTGKILFTIISAFAEFERDLIRERVKAGLERARSEGVRLGRPPLKEDIIHSIRQMRSSGIPVRTIAKELKISPAVVSKYTSHIKKSSIKSS